MDAELVNRANKLTSIRYDLNETILGHRDLDIKVKMKIYNVITLNYASENWFLRNMSE